MGASGRQLFAFLIAMAGQLLLIFPLLFGGSFAVIRRLYTDEYTSLQASMMLGSSLECAAWTLQLSKPKRPNKIFNYDQDAGLCSIFQLAPMSIFQAISKPHTEGTPFYIEGACVPSDCTYSESRVLHEDPSAFPPNLWIYLPLNALNSVSEMNVDYYKTSSLDRQSVSLGIDLWDQEFLDGTYPIWYSGDKYFDLLPSHILSSLSMFAWIYITTNLDKKDHPIITVLKKGTWAHASTLGAGHVTFGDCLSFAYSASSGQYHFMKSDEEVIQRGTWQHIGATYDADTGVASIYLNGALIKSDNFGTGHQTYALDQYCVQNTGKMEPTRANQATIAQCQGCASTHHEIYEREVCFYNSRQDFANLVKQSLNSEEVLQIYQRFHECSYAGDECP